MRFALARIAGLIGFVGAGFLASVDAAPTIVWSIIGQGTPGSLDSVLVSSNHAMAVDAVGNVYVTGATFDPDNLIIGDIGNNILTIKYSASGVEQWRAYATGRAFALAIDKSGNVYVTGDHARDRDDLFEARDYQTIKYGPDGSEQWRARTNGTANENDIASAIAVDAGGNVYVTGSSNSNYVFPASGSDLLTVKYNSSGTEQWRVTAPRAPGTESFGSAIVVDSSGNAYVAGVNFTFSNSQYLTIKYTATGAEQWRALADAAGNANQHSSPPALALDRNGNVFMAGTGGTFTNSSYLTMKYAANGVEQWRAFVDGGADPAFNVVRALTVDASGNAYVTGQNGQLVSGAFRRNDYLTVKYAPSGAELWRVPGNVASTFDAPNAAFALAVDGSGNVYVTGEASSLSGLDAVTIKYDSTGAERWRAASGNTSAFASALAIDGGGDVYVAGFNNNGLDDDFLTIKYNSAGLEQWRTSEGLATPPADFGSRSRPLRRHAMTVDRVGNAYVIGRGFNSFAPDFLTIKFDQTGMEKWRPASQTNVLAYGLPSAVATDAAGNIYVTGQGTPGDLLNPYLTFKYNPAGVEQWRTYTSNGTNYESDVPTALAVDAVGNVYVTGAAYVVGFPAPFYEYLTVKYDANGVEQWRAIDTSCYYQGPEAPYALAVDPSGNVYVSGYCNFDGLWVHFVTIKYDANGAILWRATTPSSNLNATGAYALAVDGSGYVYVAGGGINPALQYVDFLTIKYDSNGNEQWRSYGNVGQGQGGNLEALNVAADLKLDANNNVYVTGQRFNGKNSDYATIKYDSNGVEQWRAIANGAADGDDRAYALAVDANGNVYVTGESFNGVWFDHMTIRYNAAGVEQWRHTSNSKDDDASAYAIALLPGNTIYIAGDSVGQTTPPGIMLEKLIDPVATTTLASSMSPSASGQRITFTADVKGNAPKGTVDFHDGTHPLCIGVVLKSNRQGTGFSAACATNALAPGAHAITATYSGDANNAGSISLPLAQVVTNPPPGVSLASSLNPSKVGNSVTFTATVTGQAPTGTVSFKDGANALCTAVPLQGGGNAPVATCTTGALAAGAHSITAAYSGDGNNAAATSGVLVQNVKRPRH